jgi:hypothetical protein
MPWKPEARAEGMWNGIQWSNAYSLSSRFGLPSNSARRSETAATGSRPRQTARPARSGQRPRRVLAIRKPSASCLGFLGGPPPARESPPSRRAVEGDAVVGQRPPLLHGNPRRRASVSLAGLRPLARARHPGGQPTLRTQRPKAAPRACPPGVCGSTPRRTEHAAAAPPRGGGPRPRADPTPPPPPRGGGGRPEVRPPGRLANPRRSPDGQGPPGAWMPRRA